MTGASGEKWRKSRRGARIEGKLSSLSFVARAPGGDCKEREAGRLREAKRN